MTVTDETTTVDVHAVGTHHRIVFPNTEYHGFDEGQEVIVTGGGGGLGPTYRRCSNLSGNTWWNVRTDHLVPIVEPVVPTIGSEWEVVGDSPYNTPFHDGDIVRVTTVNSDAIVPHVLVDRIAPSAAFGWNLRFTDLRPKAVEPVPEPEPEPDPSEVLAEMHQGGDWHGRRRALRAAIEQRDTLLQQIEDERAERGQWSARLIERSHDVANHNDGGRWCEVFDGGMEMLGLPSRAEPEPETEIVTVTATVEVSVLFDDGDFDSWFEERHGVGISSRSGSETFCFTIDVETDVEVTEGACGCDEEIDWEPYLPDYISDHGYDWEIEDKRCSND